MRARVDAATRPPWIVEHGRIYPEIFRQDPSVTEIAVMRGNGEWSANADFIACARTDMERLLDEVEQLRAAILAHIRSEVGMETLLAERAEMEAEIKRLRTEDGGDR